MASILVLHEAPFCLFSCSVFLFLLLCDLIVFQSRSFEMKNDGKEAPVCLFNLGSSYYCYCYY